MSELSQDELDLLADLLVGEGSDEDVARVQASPRLAQALADLAEADARVAQALAELAADPAEELEPPAGFDARLAAALVAEAVPERQRAQTSLGPLAGPASAQAPGADAPGAASSTVVPLPERSHRRPSAAGPWLLRVAAGLVGLLALGGLGAGLAQLGGGRDAEESASPASADSAEVLALGQVPTSSSGFDYRAGGLLQRALPGLLAGAPEAAFDAGSGRSAAGGVGPRSTATTGGLGDGSAGGGASATGGGGGGSTSGGASGSTTGGSGSAGATGAVQAPPQPAVPEPMAADDPLARLRQPAGLQACLTALELPAGTTPEALDYARYGGRPALVVLLPVEGRPDVVEAYVVGAACGTGTDALLLYSRLDRP